MTNKEAREIAAKIDSEGLDHYVREYGIDVQDPELRDLVDDYITAAAEIEQYVLEQGGWDDESDGDGEDEYYCD